MLPLSPRRTLPSPSRRVHYDARSLSLSAVAGFLCTSIALLFAKTLRLRRSYGFWEWVFSAAQLLLGALLLAQVITPGAITIIDTSSATTLREILGFLVGVLARVSLTFSAGKVLKPSSILLPNGTPAQLSVDAPPQHYAHYVGPLFVILALLCAGAFAPYFDSWLKRLRSLDTPWASLTFAGSGPNDRFDIEADALTTTPVNLQLLLTAIQPLRRDAYISKTFPESQEAQFAETWAPTLLFFDRYLLPLSACVSLLHQQDRSDQQVQEILWRVPSSLERIMVDFNTLQEHVNAKDISEYVRYYNLSWRYFTSNLDSAVKQARELSLAGV